MWMVKEVKFFEITVSSSPPNRAGEIGKGNRRVIVMQPCPELRDAFVYRPHKRMAIPSLINVPFRQQQERPAVPRMSDFRFWESAPQAIEVFFLVNRTGPVKNKRQNISAIQPGNPLHKIPQVGVNPALGYPKDLRVNPNIHDHSAIALSRSGH
jgi:hypothetical protein